MDSILGKRKSTILIVLSAVLCGLSFTLNNLSLMMWIALVPFMYIFLNNVNSYRSGFTNGAIFGTTYYLVILQWIFNLYPLEWIDIGRKESLVILIVGWILISLIEGVVFGTILGLFRFVKCKSNIINVISISFLWVLIEWTQGIGILGFPWGKLAVSQVSILPVVQSVSILGSLFIGFLILVVNGLILLSINEKKKYKYLCIAIIIFISNYSFGIWRINKESSNEKINVSVVQGNILTAQKWKSGASQEHFKIYEELTYDAISDSGKTDIVFWPETAIPVSITYAKWLSDEYSNLAKENNINLLTGAFYTEKGVENKDYNSVYFVDEKGEAGGEYFKRHLVPFGEILPFKDIIYKIMPILEEVNLFNNDLFPGEDAVIMNTKYGKIGSAICFESIFPNLLRESVNEGAQVLFVATNDSWFKDSKAVYQHHNNSILRAIENNRYLVRAANTGISSVIDNRGIVKASIQPLERGYINSEVSFIRNKSLYTTVGDIIVFISVFYLVTIFIYKRVYKY